MPHAHTDNSFTKKIIFLEENSTTKYDEEPNNNVSATLISSLFILKSVSMLVQKSKSPTLKEDTTMDDLGDLLWLMISKKAQRSHHQRDQITKIIATKSKFALSEKSILRATEI